MEDLSPAERAIVEDFRRNLPGILEGNDPAVDYLFGWAREEPPEEAFTASHIVYTTARIAGVTVQDLRGQRRDKTLSSARQVIYLLLDRRMRGSTPAALARMVNKDRSTFVQGVKRARGRLDSDQWFRGLVRRVEEALGHGES